MSMLQETNLTNLDFFQTGGSLPNDAPTYVQRKADQDLYEGIKASEFCYVLNSRQMGKSSLRVHTMQRIQAEGIACVAIDITSIGSQQVTPEKWYASIIRNLVSGFQLSEKIDLRKWLREHDFLTPVQRLGEFIESVLLVEVSQKIAIFVDEIDSVLNLDFPTDDLFAFIRSCYNLRVDKPEYKRITFILLGVATPSDLVQDKSRTPFNIGRAIELTGLKLQNSRPLIQGLSHKASDPQTLVRIILDWTGGQPFLTQKICKLVIMSSEFISEGTEADWIENLIETQIIENWESQDEPEHLKTIHHRILSTQQSLAKILSIYENILQQGKIEVDNSPEQVELRLSGLTVRKQKNLRLYNPIYSRVFNQDWIKQTLANLQPYARQFALWMASNCEDKSCLLQGQGLKDAMAWATSRVLSVHEYQFLLASQEAYIGKKYSFVPDKPDDEQDHQSNFYQSNYPKESNSSAWKQLKEGKITLESALKLIVNSKNFVQLELLDPELYKRFQKNFPKDFDLPPLIPLLLWQNCYYLGSPVKLSMKEVEHLSHITGTQVKSILITSKSYQECSQKLGVQTGVINPGNFIKLLQFKHSTEDLTTLIKTCLLKTDDQLNRIDLIIAGAMHQGASDIHFEPSEKGLRVRYRIDGIMRDIIKSHEGIDARLVAALKAKANMNTVENRLPQDGRMRLNYDFGKKGELSLDIRISTLPCVYGEKVVIRLLPNENPFEKIDDLGFTQSALTIYKSWLREPQGMIIICGPTSSGKTSTLYTSLQEVVREEINVVTIEDPIEYILSEITQSQVHEEIGMTFSVGLRALLRQDPNVIMLGEIRDEETAETAIRAGLTGHLVLTTLHTNDAVSAIFRLNSMRIDPYLICDSLIGIVAQRLIRKICPYCSEPYKPTEQEWQYLGLEKEHTQSKKIKKGRGCLKCFNSGYLGREAIVELLKVDVTVKHFIRSGNMVEMYNYLNESNFDSFRLAAIDKVMRGITTVSELQRILPYRALHPQVSDWIDMGKR